MTKEQEAIERLNRIITTKFNNDYSIDSSDKEAIETVLNMTKQNSAEIQQKNTEIAEKNAEIEKKDKIIDEMIGSFIDLGFGFEYCNNDDRCINDCDKCIKQYFERKSK